MKKWLLVTVVAMLLLGFSACGGGSDTGSTPSAPAIYKVRMWVTLSNNPDAPSVTTLTSAQTVQASIWARGTTEKTITFKVNLCYDDKFTTLVNGVRTESSSKAVSVGALSTPLEPGNYTFQAISGAFGEIVGSSLQITVTPDTSVNTPTATTPAATLSEQPDKATFQKYFSDMNFGRVPAGATSPADFKQNVTVFSSGDQIALFFNSTQEVLVQWKIYDVQAKKVIKEGGFPKPLKGSSGEWGPLDIPAGKYEHKVYVGDVLVAIFPFEVSGAPTSTSPPQSPKPTSTVKSIKSDNPHFELMAESQHFRVYFHPPEEGLGTQIVDLGEQIYPLLIEFYGSVPPTSTQVFIYHDYEELVSLGNPPPDMPRENSMGGFTWFGKLTEEVGEHVELYNVRGNVDDAKSLLAHEVGHRFFYYVYPHIRKPVRPDWLDEGMAGYSQIRAGGRIPFQPIVDSAKSGIPPLSGITGLDKLLASSDWTLYGLFYGEAAAVILYIDCRYGKEVLQQLLREYDRTLNLQDAVLETLKIPFDQFEREWLNAVKETGAQAKNGNDFFTLFKAKMNGKST